jgi:hypothetical protein
MTSHTRAPRRRRPAAAADPRRARWKPERRRCWGGGGGPAGSRARARPRGRAGRLRDADARQARLDPAVARVAGRAGQAGRKRVRGRTIRTVPNRIGRPVDRQRPYAERIGQVERTGVAAGEERSLRDDRGQVGEPAARRDARRLELARKPGGARLVARAPGHHREEAPSVPDRPGQLGVPPFAPALVGPAGAGMIERVRARHRLEEPPGRLSRAAEQIARVRRPLDDPHTQRREERQSAVRHVPGPRRGRHAPRREPPRPGPPHAPVVQDQTRRPHGQRDRPRLLVALGVEQHVGTKRRDLAAEPADLRPGRDRQGPAPPAPRIHDEHAVHVRIALDQLGQARFHDPDHAMSRPVQIGRQRQSADRVSQGRQLQDRDIHGADRMRATRSVVAWFFASPTMATRPP